MAAAGLPLEEARLDTILLGDLESSSGGSGP